MFKRYQYKKKLKAARADLQTIFDEAARRRSYHPDKFRQIDHFMNEKERRVYFDLLTEEWVYSKLLKVNPEWGSPRDIYRNEDDMSTPASTSVHENHSTKIGYEYVELVDMMVRTINGKWSSTRWDWETVDGFKQQGWGRNQAFHDAVDDWHAAETPEAKQEVIDKYKEENPLWSL